MTIAQLHPSLRRRLPLGFWCLMAAGGVAFAQPTITHVTASQTPGNRFATIGYTLSHPQSLLCTVTLQASRDNGATWETVTTTSGALGAGITSSPGGLAKTITWTGGNDWPAQLFPQVKIRLTADDGSGRGQTPLGFLLIPAGTFSMGDALDRLIDAPTHRVTLSAFYLARNEVTWSQWALVRDWAATHGYLDLESIGAGLANTHPALMISWYDVIKWLNAKSEMEGQVPVYYTDDAQTTVYRTGNVDVTNARTKWASTGYRLPTEAEWEYAARGRLADNRFPWGNTITHQQANYFSRSTLSYDQSATRGYHPISTTLGTSSVPMGGYYTSPVGSFPANDFGLQEMTGNVSEWCWDFYGSDSYGSEAVTAPLGPTNGPNRVHRGGNWSAGADVARTAFRSNTHPIGRFPNVGFRPARSLAP